MNERRRFLLSPLAGPLAVFRRPAVECARLFFDRTRDRWRITNSRTGVWLNAEGRWVR